MFVSNFLNSIVMLLSISQAWVEKYFRAKVNRWENYLVDEIEKIVNSRFQVSRH